MKKIILMFSLVITAVGAYAQADTAAPGIPFYGVPSGTFGNHGDNTGRIWTYGQYILADTATASTAGDVCDTLTLYPKYRHNDVYLALTDSVSISISSLDQSYNGDEMVIYIAKSSVGSYGGTLHFTNSSTFYGGTYPGVTSVAGWDGNTFYHVGTGNYFYVSSITNAIIAFRFNGTYWIEEYRTQESR